MAQVIQHGRPVVEGETHPHPGLVVPGRIVQPFPRRGPGVTLGEGAVRPLGQLPQTRGLTSSTNGPLNSTMAMPTKPKEDSRR